MLTRRYELKFVVDASRKNRFLRAAQDGLEADPHGRDARYVVSSLYFDTACMRAYWEKVDGVARRRKYRLRRYAAQQGEELRWGAAFMEIKHRRNNTVFKERVAIDRSHLNPILRRPEELARLDQYTASDPRRNPATVDAIRRAALQPGFRPTCVVSYRREAWLGRFDARLRVTFDSFCSAHSSEARFSADPWQGHPLLAPTLAVMEIKFDHAIPTWIREITVAQGLRPQRFSKYATAVEALELGTRMPPRAMLPEQPEHGESRRARIATASYSDAATDVSEVATAGDQR